MIVKLPQMHDLLPSLFKLFLEILHLDLHLVHLLIKRTTNYPSSYPDPATVVEAFVLTPSILGVARSPVCNEYL